MQTYFLKIRTILIWAFDGHVPFPEIGNRFRHQDPRVQRKVTSGDDRVLDDAEVLPRSRAHGAE